MKCTECNTELSAVVSRIPRYTDYLCSFCGFVIESETGKKERIRLGLPPAFSLSRLQTLESENTKETKE